MDVTVHTTLFLRRERKDTIFWFACKAKYRQTGKRRCILGMHETIVWWNKIEACTFSIKKNNRMGFAYFSTEHFEIIRRYIVEKRSGGVFKSDK